jgi:hypothetical protein
MDGCEQNNPGRSVSDNICKNLSRMNWAFVDQPNRNNPLFDHLVYSV